jgi:ABC-type dipeptide/oligopeptide/nickel transport system ATPase component
VSVSGLTIGVGTHGSILVSDLSFEVRAGSVLGIVGESGSGKSITSLAIAGLLPPSLTVRAGEVRVDGRVTASATARRRTSHRTRVDIGVIFQDPRAALNPMLQVGAQLRRSLRARGMSRARARTRSVELLDAVGIPDPVRVAQSYPHEISGGMCQRVIIAMVLGVEPSLIIADEPTTGLDLTIQAQILALLHETVARLGCAVILITHDLAVAATMCDSMLVLYNGVPVEYGTTEKILTAAEHPYTVGLVAAVNGEVTRGANPGAISSGGEGK